MGSKEIKLQIKIKNVFVFWLYDKEIPKQLIIWLMDCFVSEIPEGSKLEAVPHKHTQNGTLDSSSLTD